MKTIWAWGTVGVAAVSIVAGAAAQQANPPAVKKPVVKQEAKEADEKDEAQKPAATIDLPPAVRAAFKKAYPMATIKGTDKEAEDGKTVYEIESVDQGKNRNLVYRPDGTVLEIEEQIPASDLPRAVTNALKQLYPKATITLAERATKGRIVVYELNVAGAPKPNVAFTPEGKLIPPEPAK